VPGSAPHRIQAGMILVPAACVGLSAVAGCSGAASTASISLTQPPVAATATVPVAPSSLQVTVPSATSAASSLPADPPGSSSGGGSSGDSSAGYSAVLNMQDGQGDSYTQTFTFGSPEPEPDVPDAINGLQTCQLGVAIPARNLVVPVQITTTLTTSIQTQIPIGMNVSQYTSTAANSGIPGDVVYQTTSGDQCETDQEGAQVTLSQGQSATSQAWIVLQDAITPAYPNGDPAQLGVNFVFFGYAGSDDVTSAQGSAVCTGDPQIQQQFSPPYLVFAGNVPAGEGCGGQYTAPPD
jgi:hypothetical protein